MLSADSNLKQSNENAQLKSTKKYEIEVNIKNHFFFFFLLDCSLIAY